MKPDPNLIRELEGLSTGDTVHLRLNLSGTYSSAIEQFNESGDPRLQTIVDDAQRELRILLTQLRLRHA